MPTTIFSLTAFLSLGTVAGALPATVAPETAPPKEIAITPLTGPGLLGLVRASKARAVLVNVWATWCIPCREEFPEILRLRSHYESRGLEVILVSGDFDDTLAEARKFLAEQGVDFATYVKSGADMEFINTLDPDWSGALPATFVFDSTGKRRHSLFGKGTYDAFEKNVLDVLNETGRPR